MCQFVDYEIVVEHNGKYAKGRETRIDRMLSEREEPKILKTWLANLPAGQPWDNSQVNNDTSIPATVLRVMQEPTAGASRLQHLLFTQTALGRECQVVFKSWQWRRQNQL